jgi:hypothetical protein
MLAALSPQLLVLVSGCLTQEEVFCCMRRVCSAWKRITWQTDYFYVSEAVHVAALKHLSGLQEVHVETDLAGHELSPFTKSLRAVYFLQPDGPKEALLGLLPRLEVLEAFRFSRNETKGREEPRSAEHIVAALPSAVFNLVLNAFVADELSGLLRLEELRRLSLVGCWLSQASLDLVLAQLPRLQDLGFSQRKGLVCPALVNLPQLQVLCYSATNPELSLEVGQDRFVVDGRFLEQVTRCTPALTCLELQGELGRDTLLVLAGLPEKLQQLDLGDTLPIDFMDLVDMRGCRPSSLVISNVWKSQLPPLFYAILNSWKHLESLELTGVANDDADQVFAEVMKRLPRLQRVTIGHVTRTRKAKPKSRRRRRK